MGWECGVFVVVVFKKLFFFVLKLWVSMSLGFFFVSVVSRRVERGFVLFFNFVFLFINENV